MINVGLENDQSTRMKRYYRFQSKIYDHTRWMFLFGRSSILHLLPLAKNSQPKILEVGCGTGFNLKRMNTFFKKAELIGVDVSNDMLSLAKKNCRHSNQIKFLNDRYSSDLFETKNQFDLILFSYSLSMINPGWEQLIEAAFADLAPGGLIAVVDFNDSRYKALKKHMKNNHVRMDHHILPILEERFSSLTKEINSAYVGAWTYFTFVGLKPY